MEHNSEPPSSAVFIASTGTAACPRAKQIQFRASRDRFYHPKQNYNVRVASRHYKGPELLVDLEMSGPAFGWPL